MNIISLVGKLIVNQNQINLVLYYRVIVGRVMIPKESIRQSKTEEFKYQQTTPVELHEVVKTLLVCSKNSAPYFPPLFTKKLCERQGLQCNQNVFFNLMSNIVDFKLDQCINEIKENVVAGSSKKQVKELTLKTVDVEKYFLDKEFKHARPRIYPQMEISSNTDDTLMPEVPDAKM